MAPILLAEFYMMMLGFSKKSNFSNCAVDLLSIRMARSHALRGNVNRTLCVHFSSKYLVKSEYYHSLEIWSPFFDKQYGTQSVLTAFPRKAWERAFVTIRICYSPKSVIIRK